MIEEKELPKENLLGNKRQRKTKIELSIQEEIEKSKISLTQTSTQS